MHRVDVLTEQALAFGLRTREDPACTARRLADRARGDGGLLRQALARIERGCRERRTATEDRALWVLRLALDAIERPDRAAVHAIYGATGDAA